MATCERCGAQVEIRDLLWHEAAHDQIVLMFEETQRQITLASEALRLLCDQYDDLEGRLADVER